MAPTAEQEKKQLQLADDYHKMKEFYYERYMSQLRNKIREHDKKPSPSNSRRSSVKSAPQQTKRPNERSSQAPKRKPVHKPVKTAIPKSQRLTLLESEEKLRKAGYLQTDAELMEFRNGVSSAEDIEKYTDDYIAQRTRVSSSKKSVRPLSRITETRENSPNKSRPGSKQVVKKQMDTNLNPLGGNRKVSPADIAKAAAQALEKRCPRMDIPNLHCLRSDSDDSDGEAEIAREHERGKRRDEYSSHVGYLRQMYQRAQANTAQAKRIIDNRDDDVLHDRSRLNFLSDLSTMCDEMTSPTHTGSPLRPPTYHQYDADSSIYDPAYDVPDLSDTEGDNYNVTSVVGHQTQEDKVKLWREETQHAVRQPFNVFTPIEEEPMTPTENQVALISGQSELALQQTSQLNKPKESTEMLALEDGSKPQQPLNFDLLQEEVKILESKVLSSYWPNYLSVGKSKFSREDTS